MPTPHPKIPYLDKERAVARTKSFSKLSRQQFSVRYTESFSDAILHWHDYSQIWYVRQGIYNQKFLGKSILQKSGSVMIIPPFHNHGVCDFEDHPYQVYCIEFSREFVDQILDSRQQAQTFFRPMLFEGNKEYYVLPPEIKSWVDEQLFDITEKFYNNREKCLVLQRGTIKSLLGEIAQQALKSSIEASYSAAWQHFKTVQQAIEFIDQNYNRVITVDEISRFCNLSRCSFSRIFKQVTGNTFTEFLSMIRVHYAKNELAKSDDPLDQIAERCGFHCKANFYRKFKLYEGFTPEYLRKHRGGWSSWDNQYFNIEE